MIVWTGHVRARHLLHLIMSNTHRLKSPVERDSLDMMSTLCHRIQDIINHGQYQERIEDALRRYNQHTNDHPFAETDFPVSLLLHRNLKEVTLSPADYFNPAFLPAQKTKAKVNTATSTAQEHFVLTCNPKGHYTTAFNAATITMKPNLHSHLMLAWMEMALDYWEHGKTEYTLLSQRQTDWQADLDALLHNQEPA